MYINTSMVGLKWQIKPTMMVLFMGTLKWSWACSQINLRIPGFSANVSGFPLASRYCEAGHLMGKLSMNMFVTIFHSLYGLYIPLPCDSITCAAAFTFSFLYCTLATHTDSLSTHFFSLLLCSTHMDSQCPTLYRVWLRRLL